MLFHEIYSSYFNAVAEVLQRAVEGNFSDRQLSAIVQDKAFEESCLTIPGAVLSGQWPLLRRDGRTPIRHVPTMPLTDLQRMWLKAILQDPRVRLFLSSGDDLEDVPPLFERDFFVYFDRYGDGDPFTDPLYREHFRLILLALREKRKIQLQYKGKNGRHRQLFVPEKLEYSSKDDKFRLLAHTPHGVPYVINMGRILHVELGEPAAGQEMLSPAAQTETLVLELVDERNALERAMLHFSDLEKETVKLDETHYRILLRCRRDDETELLIRVLSFGPKIRAVAPDSFVEQVRERLRRQKKMIPTANALYREKHQ